jgi:DNA-binding NtrC family response regulator
MSKDFSQTSKTDRADHPFFGKKTPLPGLLIIHAPLGACAVDRCPLTLPFIVGRSSTADLPVTDERISKAHFRISRQQGELFIEDNGSTNGTYVQGRPLVSKQSLTEPTVIRAGQSLFCFVPDITRMLRSKRAERYGMAGTFHTDVLASDLEDAAQSVRHILLSGPSGTGKELASKAVFSIMQDRGLAATFVAHNAARFANEEEASTTLFGVGAKVFSNVEAREGLIEAAHNGVLFLDEVHNLPERVQRTLLRIMEDGQTSRIGETKMRPAKVRFVLASNAEGATCGLAHDLFARVRLVRIAPLSERIGDIPDIFLKVIMLVAEKYHVDGTTVARHLGADHYEALCIDGLPFDNVRGLVDLADRIMTRVSAGVHAGTAIQDVFSERFSDSPVVDRGDTAEDIEGAAHYINNKEYIIAAYRECHANMSAVERVLKTRGFQCSRRWLTHYLERWGVKPK